MVSSEIDILKKTELHVHDIQALYPQDLFELAKDHYKEINWNRFGFLDRYEHTFGVRPDPIAVFEKAAATGSLQEIERICYYKYKGAGNFDEFNVKSYFPYCITGYYFDRDDHVTVLKRIVDRHKREGLTYVEYRHGFAGSGEEWKNWHARFARFFRDASTYNFTAKYIIRLGAYAAVKEILQEHPDLNDTIVGVDFSGPETAPEKLADFYREVEQDRKRDPKNTVEIVVHIGEDFFDKSLESAIRWCHQSALFGARRLAHCIALGINPGIAVNRRRQAHAYESAGERASQLKYDLEHYDGLNRHGVRIDRTQIEREIKTLEGANPDAQIYRTYDEQRLEDVSKRQDYVLNDLKRLGTVIEVCPTSNLCIGGIPSIADHPFPKLYRSGVNIAVCTDDPGVFGISLRDEVDFVIRAFGLSPSELSKRLGDPYRFRLKAQESPALLA